METSLILTINLLGNLSKRAAHTDKQTFSVNVTPLGVKKQVWLTRKIKHTDRKPVECSKKLNVSNAAVSYWKSDNCPDWVDFKVWRKLNSEERIAAHVQRFDEGYGVSYE